MLKFILYLRKDFIVQSVHISDLFTQVDRDCFVILGVFTPDCFILSDAPAGPFGVLLVFCSGGALVSGKRTYALWMSDIFLGSKQLSRSIKSLSLCTQIKNSYVPNVF